MDTTNNSEQVEENVTPAVTEETTEETTSNNDNANEEEVSDEKETSNNDDSSNEEVEESESDDESNDESDDEVSDDELAQLDSKVRRNLSKVRRENANLRERFKAAEHRALRAEVALNAGLPANSIKFLTGETEKELMDNAEELLVMFGGKGRVTPPNLPHEYGSGNGDNSVPKPVNLDEIGKRMYAN